MYHDKDQYLWCLSGWFKLGNGISCRAVRFVLCTGLIADGV